MAQRKEARREICEKCKQEFYVHRHHILSKALFGEGETIDLCPNCHTHYHEYANKNLKNPKNKEEVLRVWNKWFKSITITCIIIALYLAVDLFIL